MKYSPRGRHPANIKEKQQKGFSLFEFLVVLVVISIIIYSGFDVYKNQIELSRVKTLHFQSSAFSRMVQNIHAYAVSTKNMKVDLLKKTVFLNEYGFPANTQASLSRMSSEQTSLGCKQLWYAFFTTVSDADKNISRDMVISVKEKSLCRYDFYPNQAETLFFDYHFKTGEVLVNVPK